LKNKYPVISKITDKTAWGLDYKLKAQNAIKITGTNLNLT
jgi:hypothetical protein